MQLYRANGQGFVNDLEKGNLPHQLAGAFRNQLGRAPSQSELNSWLHSLPAVAEQLQAAGLLDVEVLVEYILPRTSYRIDVVLIGRHPSTGKVSALVWENKQWTVGQIESVEYRTVSVAGRLLLHPQQQVNQYVEYLSDFNKLFEDGSLEINGLTYLHNATEADIKGLRDPELADVSKYPMFTSDRKDKLQEFLKGSLSNEGADRAANEFLEAPICPSKKLLEHVKEQIKGNDEFHLLNEQLIAKNKVLSAVHERYRTNTKKVIVVKGGPGSGKSVIAANVMGDLSKENYKSSYVVGSRSFNRTLRNRVGGNASKIFKFTHYYADADTNELDVLVVDEAHRIRKNTPRKTVPQVQELINAARVSLFLLDEHQGVREEEIGTVDAITASANHMGAEVISIDLDAQFRCAGSEAYVRWVDRLLGLEGDGPTNWTPDENFELLFAESPAVVESYLRGKLSQCTTARLTAGYCWPWRNPVGDRLVNDVAIGNWGMPWNLNDKKKVKGIPSASLWASDPTGFGQVGCIYSAQGFEYDYAGVIMGPDLVWRSGSWHACPRESHDDEIKNASNFDELVRNVYRVLLTRGLKGCVVMSADDETSAMLANRGIPKLS